MPSGPHSRYVYLRPRQIASGGAFSIRPIEAADLQPGNSTSSSGQRCTEDPGCSGQPSARNTRMFVSCRVGCHPQANRAKAHRTKLHPRGIQSLARTCASNLHRVPCREISRPRRNRIHLAPACNHRRCNTSRYPIPNQQHRKRQSHRFAVCRRDLWHDQRTTTRRQDQRVPDCLHQQHRQNLREERPRSQSAQDPSGTNFKFTSSTINHTVTWSKSSELFNTSRNS